MTNLFMNNYTHSAEQADCQSAASCCKYVEMVHAVLGAVCTFVFALAIIRGAIGVLISLAIIHLIIKLRENRIFEAKEVSAA